MLTKNLEKMIEDGMVAVGDTVWVCQLRFDDPLNKPIRNVTPVRAVIFDAADVKKRVYYSNICFVPLSKRTDLPMMSKVLSPYDNTGFRAYTGESLNIFFTEDEAMESYRADVARAVEQLEQVKRETVERLDKKIFDIKAWL